MDNILETLNNEQRMAVEHIDGPLLILAGAGTGKTKTITTRLAYLIDYVGIAPDSTLTLTFTNKASIEMRNRAMSMINDLHIQPPLLCTFHKFGLLFLKFNIQHLGRSSTFIVADSDDKKRIIKGIKSNISTGLLVDSISRFKNACVGPSEAIDLFNDPISKEIARVYTVYENNLISNNMVDFDDLLLLTYRILDSNHSVRDDISSKYRYIMVDEYQDTNELQFKLLKQLCSNHSNICVVGDDDQSIYGWRGADINNIINFSNEFIDSKTITLGKNYRSTTQILDAANKLISLNTKRIGKNLVSVKGRGKDVEILESSDERTESMHISKRIKELVSSGVSSSDIAILFRLNALSRGLEEGLSREKIPYKIIGAVRFYDRAEIKDILSYLRLIVNIHDNFSLLRIINRPKRGIGKTTQDKLEKFASQMNISIHDAMLNYKYDIGISNTQISAIEGFFETIYDLRSILEESITLFLDSFIDKINILDTFNNVEDEIDRKANINEFYGVFRDYIYQNPTASLDDFLNDISLRSDNDDELKDAISCMSIHSAKGLEFDYLFVIGLEEGFFPITSDTSDIQEERRLGYVAFTRAKKELYLSFAKSRFYKGRRTALRASRFFSEAGFVLNRVASDSELRENDLVSHKIFGMGRVVEVIGTGNDCILKINFAGQYKNIRSSFVSKV